MAKKQEATVEVVVEETKEEKNRLFEMAHKAILMGFGVVGMGQDFIVDGRKEMTKFFEKLVDRGEKMEQETRQRLDEALHRAKVEEEEVIVEPAV